jgi:hypothetical protein
MCGVEIRINGDVFLPEIEKCEEILKKIKI